MSVLTLPSGSRPTNLHLSPEMQHAFVDGDLYDICNRIKEIDPRLYIVDLHKADTEGVFAIMEPCPDGFDRLVFKVKQLDERVCQRLRYLMALPLKARMEVLEKEEHAFNEAKREHELEELYEQLGRPMWTQLEHDGFIQRGISFPKRGVAGGRGSAKRS